MISHDSLGVMSIYFGPSAVPDISELIAQLVENFGAKITCHDWYNDRRQMTLRLIELREKGGKPIPMPQLLIEVLDRAESEGTGRRVGLALPMEGGGYMIGDITAGRLVLTANCPLRESKSAEAIISFLRSQEIVTEVEIA